MSEKVFFDTNILVYAIDNHDKTKQKISRDIMQQAAVDRNGVVSTQILQEFFVTVTKKLKVSPLDAKKMLLTFNNYETITVSPELIYQAVDISILNQLSFWDSLVISCAGSAVCSTLYTEDLNHSQIINTVKITNPFA